jgi:hypothetical protein
MSYLDSIFGKKKAKGRKAPKHRIKSWEKHKKQLLKKEYAQTGQRKSVQLDRNILAKHSGWRTSKKGKLYFETRKNRSDKKGTRL